MQPVVERYLELAARERDFDRALTPVVRDRSRRDRSGARPGGEGLPHTALPDGRGDLVRTVHADELDVRALREALMPLEQRAEPQQLLAPGLSANDGVRVADAH